MNQRYQRQQLVNHLGQQSQVHLANARVLIIGVGGLGSPVSTLLAGAGVGQITLVDYDVVSLSNLHRQTLFTENDIDQPKVITAKKRLQAINSEISINAVNQALYFNNAEVLIRQHDIVIDAADSFFTSYLLSDICLAQRTPLVSASVLTTNGYVGVFCGTKSVPTPSIRAVFPSPPLTTQNCNTAGVTGPSVAVIGGIQAQEVLKIIVQSSSQLSGRLLQLDLWDYRQNIINFSNAKEPKRFAKLISLKDIANDDLLLDVRSEVEIARQPRQRPFIAIPADKISKDYSRLNPSSSIVCVCKSGHRALYAAHQLIELGFKNIRVAQ